MNDDHHHLEMLRACRPFPDYAVDYDIRTQLAYAVAHAEREIVLVDGIHRFDTRVLVTHLEDNDDPLYSVTIVSGDIQDRTRARYTQTESEAPKRSSLLRRLWSLLR